MYIKLLYIVLYITCPLSRVVWCVFDMIQHLTVANIWRAQNTICLHNPSEIQHTGYDFSSILPLPLLPRSDNFTSPDADGIFFTRSPAALYSISSNYDFNKVSYGCTKCTEKDCKRVCVTS